MDVKVRFFDSRELALGMVGEIVIDDVRFSPEALLALARSAGQLFVAERQDDHVTVQMVSALKTPGKPQYVWMGHEAARLAFGGALPGEDGA